MSTYDVAHLHRHRVRRSRVRHFATAALLAGAFVGLVAVLGAVAHLTGAVRHPPVPPCCVSAGR